MNGFHLSLEAFDVLDQIHIRILSRDLSESILDRPAPVTVQQLAVQAPASGDRREWLQDALIAALEAL